jgi:nucleotide-binding universal stress UspA family protein
MTESIERILLTTDLSDESWCCADLARDLAKVHGARLHVLHVVDENLFAGGALYSDGSLATPALVHYFETAEKYARESIAEALAERDLEAEVTIRQASDVAGTIDAVATEQKSCLVVLSTHGRTGWRRFLLGSTATHVVRTCSRPVLTVRSAGDDAAELCLHQPIRRVLFTTDLSDHSFSALPWAETFARAHGASLTILSVIEEPYYLSHLEQPASVIEVLKESVPTVEQRIRERLPALDVPVQVKVLQSKSPVATILETAEAGADLVVLATRGSSGWLPHLLVGSTAEHLTRSCHVPVLTVR